MDFGGLLGGIGNLFGGAARGVGNFFNQGANMLGQGAGAIGGGINNLFSHFGQGASSGYNGGGGGGGGNPGGGGPNYNLSKMMGSQNAGYYGMGMPSSQPSFGGNQGGGNGGGFGSMFTNHPFQSGAAALFGSQLIGNPSAPKLPPSFYNFQNQANQGGPQIQRTGAQAISGIANRPFQQVSQEELNTILRPLQLKHQEEQRALDSQYKSLRPGTDLTSDTTYQRDWKNLQFQQDEEIKNATASLTRGIYNDYAGQQIQAGQAAGQLGGEQANQQLATIESQVNQIATQWQMSYQQREALRQQLMQQAGLLMGYPILGGIAKMFGQGMRGQ